MISPATATQTDSAENSGQLPGESCAHSSREPDSSAGDRRGNIRALLLLSLLYLAVRLPWLLCVPITEAPDEANHLWVAQFLRDHLRLPGALEVASAGTPAVYGSLPQLGYLPHVLIGQFFASENFAAVARFGSLLSGLPTLWCAWLLAKELFADSRMRRRVLPLLVVFHPQLVFTQSYTNNDTLGTTLASASICLAVIAIKRGLTRFNATAAGIMLGVAALSKYTTLTLVPAVMMALLVGGLLNGAAGATIVLCLSLFLASFSLTCGWWFLRNFSEYGTDVLGTRTMYETWSQILPRDESGRIINPWPPVQKTSWWRFVFFDFWGLFGYMNRYMWRPIYIALQILCAASVLGWVSSSISNSLNERQSEPMTLEKKKTVAIWLTLLACVLLNFASVLQVTLANVSGPHGRYLFPSELAIVALLLAGFSKFKPRTCKLLTWALLAICVNATVSSFYAYYAP